MTTLEKDSNNVQIDQTEIIDGINSILSMFKVIGQKLFPRNIMTADFTGFFPVGDEIQMMNAFEQAKFRDCRISAYPPVSSETLQIPNISLLDFDYDKKLIAKYGKLHANFVLMNQVNVILKKLQHEFNIRNFMVLHTGHGRHVMIPFIFDTPFDKLKELSPYLKFIHKSRKNPGNNISEEFLVFCKSYLSNNLADKENRPGFSNMLLRVPGTLNTKMTYGTIEKVKIEHSWNYEDVDSIPTFGDLFPDTDLFLEFIRHLGMAAATQLDEDEARKKPYRIRSPLKSSKITWIETLHETTLSDCRKRVIWLILTRYAINVRRMSHQEAFIWIRQWVRKCDQARKFDENFLENKIDYYLEQAVSDGYYPPTLGKLESWGWKMEGGISLYDLLANKMTRNKH